MFDDKNVPQNLPTGGKNMLDNMNPDAKEPSPPDTLAPKTPPAPAAPAPRPVVSPAPVEVDDIFSDAKEAPPASRVTPAPPSPPPVDRAPLAAKMTEETMVETPRQGFKKILITAGLVALFAGLASVGGYWAYNNFLKPKPLSPMLNLNAGGVEPAAPEAAPPVPETAQSAPEAAQPAFIDNDNDGLTDTEEQALGTAVNNPDTDGDGLFDGEETKVYKTDPLNSDTDGDTYKDGDEVKSGYDPKGPGKLIRIPAGQ